jgi:hypothetical protein
MEERMNAYRIFVGKPEGKRPIGTLSPRRQNNIKIYLRDVGWGSMA